MYEIGKRYHHERRPQGVTLEEERTDGMWLAYDHGIGTGGHLIAEAFLREPWAYLDGGEPPLSGPMVAPPTFNHAPPPAPSKVDLTLIPPYAAAQMCRAFEHGLTKYPKRFDWRGKVSVRELASKCARHVFMAVAGFESDEESGLSHWAHAMAECAMILDTLAWEAQGRPEVVDPEFYK